MDKSDSLKVLKTAVTYFKPSHFSAWCNKFMQNCDFNDASILSNSAITTALLILTIQLPYH